MPHVAVVIPAHNHAEYLAESVQSVLTQTYPHIHLLVIDDGSTDDTPLVLNGFGDNVRWFSRENRGQVATLNEGWALTEGELLLYLGDDDFLLPGAIEIAVDALTREPACIGVYGDYRIVDRRSRTLRSVTTPEVDLVRMLREFVIPPAAGTLFRRSVWERVGGWDPSLRQVPDRDFFLRALRYGHLLRIPVELAAFRVHQESQTFAPRDENAAQEPICVIDRYFAQQNVPPEARPLEHRAKALARVVAARHCLRRGSLSAAARLVADAVRLSPKILLSRLTWRFLLNGLRGPLGVFPDRFMGPLTSR